MGRFCVYFSQSENAPVQQMIAGITSTKVCSKYVDQSCGLTLSTVPPQPEFVQRFPSL